MKGLNCYKIIVNTQKQMARRNSSLINEELIDSVTTAYLTPLVATLEVKESVEDRVDQLFVELGGFGKF